MTEYPRCSMKTRCGFAAVVVWLLLASSLRANFIPGHVFVSYPAGKFCGGEGAGWDQIWEINPQTGGSRLFVELAEEDCGYVSGLAFTPDGSRLLVSLLIKNQVVEYDSQGNQTVRYDTSDGMSGPFGFNNLAYDLTDENLYVLNHTATNIVRIPVSGGPTSLFANSSDGITGAGPIAFAADGDLYYGNVWSGGWYVQRINPQGQGFPFDEYDNTRCPTALTADNDGNVYVALTGSGVGELYKYTAGNPSSKTLLTTGAPARGVLAMAPDQTAIFAAASTNLYAVDPVSGASTLLAQLSDLPWGPPYGIAVVPPPGPIPAISDWGWVVLCLLMAAAGSVLVRERNLEMKMTRRR